MKKICGIISSDASLLEPQIDWWFLLTLWCWLWVCTHPLHASSPAHWPLIGPTGFPLRLITVLIWQFPRKIIPPPSKHPNCLVDSYECLARFKTRWMPHSIPSNLSFSHHCHNETRYPGLHGIGIGHPQPAHELGLDAHLVEIEWLGFYGGSQVIMVRCWNEIRQHCFTVWRSDVSHNDGVQEMNKNNNKQR